MRVVACVEHDYMAASMPCLVPGVQVAVRDAGLAGILEARYTARCES